MIKLLLLLFKQFLLILIGWVVEFACWLMRVDSRYEYHVGHDVGADGKESTVILRKDKQTGEFLVVGEKYE